MKYPALAIGIACVVAVAVRAEDAPCEALLHGNLYSEYKFTNTGSFDQDFRTYLLSDQFLQDLHNGRWGGSIAVPIDGVPVQVGANSSDADSHTFQEKIRSATSLHVEFTSFQSVIASIPNQALYDAYVECIRAWNHGKGIQVTATSGSDWANFKITYSPMATTDRAKIRVLEVLNATKVSTSLRAGHYLDLDNQVACVRDPSKDLILNLQTDHGVASYRVPAHLRAPLSSDAPVGTVVASFLKVDQFYAASKSNVNNPGGIWTAAGSLWCPADGRAVPGSQYMAIASQDHVPDLRGVFLRCVNVMEAVPEIPLNAVRSDPENRPAASFQRDLIKSHTLNVSVPSGGFRANTAGGGNDVDVWYKNHEWKESTNAVVQTTGDAFGDETRPKNVAVFYYVRIN